MFVLRYRDEIEKLERERAAYRAQIKDTCGEKEYNNMKTDVYESIEQAKRFDILRIVIYIGESLSLVYTSNFHGDFVAIL